MKMEYMNIALLYNLPSFEGISRTALPGSSRSDLANITSASVHPAQNNRCTLSTKMEAIPNKT